MPNDNDQHSELLFYCPHTDRPLNTGIKTDYRSLATAWDEPMHLQCSHCGMEHIFTIRDVCFNQALRLVRRYVAIDATHLNRSRPHMNQLGKRPEVPSVGDLVDGLNKEGCEFQPWSIAEANEDRDKRLKPTSRREVACRREAELPELVKL